MINIGNVGKAIFYFVIGVVVNIVLYNIFSPSKANMLSMLNAVFQIDTGTTNVIWLGILAIGILVNVLYPIWCLYDTEKAPGEQ